MSFGTRLLHLDSAAGLTAGAGVLVFSSWLSTVYRLPSTLIIVMGAANLMYGAYSGLLARRPRRSRRLVGALVVANASWAVLCAVTAVVVVRTASVFGLAHLVGEALFVGGLAAFEWHTREQIIR